MPKDAIAPFHRNHAQDSGRIAQRAGEKLAAVILAFAATTLTGCGVTMSSDTPTTTGVLTASTATLDFGSATVGVTVGEGSTVTFTNTSSKDVAFTATPLVGNEFKVASTTCAPTLPAGKSCAVNVSFTPTAPGPRSGSLQVTSGNQTTGVALHGVGMQPATLSLSKPSVGFADTLIGANSASQQINVNNTGDAALPIALSVTGNFKQTATTCTQTLAPRSTCTATLAFAPVLRGANQGSLTATSGTTAVAAALTGNGLAAAHVLATPSTVAFPDTPLQTASGSTAVTVTNDGDIDAPLGTPAASQDFSIPATTCAQTVPAHGQCVVQVAFKPASSGSKTGTASLVAAGSPVQVALSGNAYAPAVLTLTPASLSFASTLTGTSTATSPIVISNSGDRAAAVRIPSAPQDFALGATNCTATLAAHAQCTINVQFAPSFAGPRTGQLAVAYDNSSVNASLSGTAISSSNLQIWPTAANFPDVLPGVASIAIPFVLTNTGTSASPVSTLQVSDSFQVNTNNCGASLAGHASCTVTVIFRAANTGARTGQLTVQSKGETIQSNLSGNAAQNARALPVLQALTPSIVNPGVSTTVHLTGTGLDTIDSVLVDGVTTPVTKISATDASFVAAPPSWAVGSISLMAHANVSGNSNALPLAINPPPVTYDTAVRFTQQAAVGTTADQIAQIQTRGLSKWVDWQFTTPMYPYETISGLAYSVYMNNTQNSNYALRQRVTMALKQIFTFGMSDACSMLECGHYWEARLQQDAFGNARTLLYDVATSPMMGTFLQNTRNYAYYPWTGQYRANANFAREFMQLMTIGPYQLNRDGSQILDSYGQPLPTYNEANVTDSAAAMSGWFYADHGDWTPLLAGNPLLPMVPVEMRHDPNSKTILPGVTLPAGQGSVKDMNDVVDALFNHPNIAPFLCRRLIQHLVTSNPSPAYIARAVSVFENNGSGVRGDLGAVVKAILLDSEARRGDDPNGVYTQTETRFMDPLLYISSVVSALGVGYSDDQIYNVTGPLGQDLFMSNTVFGAYSPDNKLPTGQFAPEVQLMSDAAALQKIAFVNNVTHGTLPGIGGSISNSVFWNSPNPTALVNQMNHFLFHGTMPSSVQTALNAYISDNSTKTTNQMLPDLMLIVLNTSAYQVAH